MCELLGMSANVPTDICFSLTGLMERGGRTGPHRDGWGVAFYLDGEARTFHDPHPGVHSQIATVLKCNPIKSHLVISHIRQANVGEVSLINTHPFSRRLWGRTWSFAHNGQLRDSTSLHPVRFRPVGATDSELAFCWILDELSARFPSFPDDPEELSQVIQELGEALRQLGVFNMLMTDGERVYAYCSTKLCWLTRRAPFGQARLRDAELIVDFEKETTPHDVVSVVATEPLTCNECWTCVAPGEMCVFRDGEVRSYPPLVRTMHPESV